MAERASWRDNPHPSWVQRFAERPPVDVWVEECEARAKALKVAEALAAQLHVQLLGEGMADWMRRARDNRRRELLRTLEQRARTLTY